MSCTVIMPCVVVRKHVSLSCEIVKETTALERLSDIVGSDQKHRTHKGHEEKQTDVNMALTLLEQATDNSFDRALVISVDADQLPALQAVKWIAPTKHVGITFPPSRPNRNLACIIHLQRITWTHCCAFRRVAFMRPEAGAIYGALQQHDE